jgi:hypothetical protein
MVLGINSGGDPPDDLEVFLDAFQMTFPILLDSNGVYQIYRQSGATSPYPLDYVIDQGGNVAYFATEYDPEAMTSVIDDLLSNTAAMDVEPTSLDFGEVPVGEQSGALLTITNSGTGDLYLDSITSDSSEFTANLAQLLVPPAAQRTLLVTFAPTDSGSRTGVLTMTGNDPDNPRWDVPLDGVGTPSTDVGQADIFLLRLTNAPNPFNPRTDLLFTLPAAGPVDLSIYNARGRVVRRLLRGEHYPAGDHQLFWDGLDEHRNASPSGVYLVRLTSGDEEIRHKIALLR